MIGVSLLTAYENFLALSDKDEISLQLFVAISCFYDLKTWVILWTFVNSFSIQICTGRHCLFYVGRDGMHSLFSNPTMRKITVKTLACMQRLNIIWHPNWSWEEVYTRRFSNHESRLFSRSHTFAIFVILDLKIHQSMWIHWPFFPKTWTKGHWPLDDLWPHVCWRHMCDSTQGSLCPSPKTIHQCTWIQWSILQNTTYILHTYYVHTTYRMSDT